MRQGYGPRLRRSSIIRAKGHDAKIISITPIGYQGQKTIKTSRAVHPVLLGRAAVTIINPPTVQMKASAHPYQRRIVGQRSSKGMACTEVRLDHMPDCGTVRDQGFRGFYAKVR